MSLAQAEEKLKEFFYYMSPRSGEMLRRAYEALRWFSESYDARRVLMENIRDAIDYSFTLAYDANVLIGFVAFSVHSDIMIHYGIYYNKIVVDADINAFIEFLDKVIKILSEHSGYVEWVRRSWEDMEWVLRKIFGI